MSHVPPLFSYLSTANRTVSRRKGHVICYRYYGEKDYFVNRDTRPQRLYKNLMTLLKCKNNIAALKALVLCRKKETLAKLKCTFVPHAMLSYFTWMRRKIE